MTYSGSSSVLEHLVRGRDRFVGDFDLMAEDERYFFRKYRPILRAEIARALLFGDDCAFILEAALSLGELLELSVEDVADVSLDLRVPFGVLVVRARTSQSSPGQGR